MGWRYVQRSSGISHREFLTQFASDDQRRLLDVAAPRWDESLWLSPGHEGRGLAAMVSGFRGRWEQG